MGNDTDNNIVTRSEEVIEAAGSAYARDVRYSDPAGNNLLISDRSPTAAYIHDRELTLTCANGYPLSSSIIAGAVNIDDSVAIALTGLNKQLKDGMMEKGLFFTEVKDSHDFGANNPLVAKCNDLAEKYAKLRK